jgi:protein-L-isoaspartate(D-aspartate) O-methyltransferase
LAQLAIGGRMVIPVGTTNQVLTVIERMQNEYVQTKLEAVKFVPLLGGIS